VDEAVEESSLDMASSDPRKFVLDIVIRASFRPIYIDIY